MTDKIRQDFERRSPVPADAVYNNQLDMYCRTSDIRHQHQELWQVWQAAHEEYAGAPDGQGEPVVQSDREAWLASLFPEDRMFEEIRSMATRTYRRHCTSAKGQQVSAADVMESHLIWATKRWIEINEPAPATNPAEQQPAPDVDVLVEALESIASGEIYPMQIARAAIEAAKRQEEGNE